MQLNELNQVLQSSVPAAQLRNYTLEHTDGVTLALINADYPQQELAAEQVERLMDSPPYWAFCWASGWVLAQRLVHNPDWVRNKRVLDFGCGSGVAGIAALKQGASACVFCDTDAWARASTRYNLRLNGFSLNHELQPISLVESLNDLQNQLFDTALIADVFYDADNLPLLEALNQCCAEVIVADSRLGRRSLTNLNLISQHEASTIPDLGEALAFRQVSIYRSASSTNSVCG